MSHAAFRPVAVDVFENYLGLRVLSSERSQAITNNIVYFSDPIHSLSVFRLTDGDFSIPLNGNIHYTIPINSGS